MSECRKIDSATDAKKEMQIRLLWSLSFSILFSTKIKLLWSFNIKRLIVPKEPNELQILNSFEV
jgi:hypothetical protein